MKSTSEEETETNQNASSKGGKKNAASDKEMGANQNASMGTHKSAMKKSDELLRDSRAKSKVTIQLAGTPARDKQERDKPVWDKPAGVHILEAARAAKSIGSGCRTKIFP